MVWEQNTKGIVMLNRLYEKGIVCAFKVKIYVDKFDAFKKGHRRKFVSPVKNLLEDLLVFRSISNVIMLITIH